MNCFLHRGCWLRSYIWHDSAYIYIYIYLPRYIYIYIYMPPHRYIYVIYGAPGLSIYIYLTIRKRIYYLEFSVPTDSHLKLLAGLDCIVEAIDRFSTRGRCWFNVEGTSCVEVEQKLMASVGRFHPLPSAHPLLPVAPIPAPIIPSFQEFPFQACTLADIAFGSKCCWMGWFDSKLERCGSHGKRYPADELDGQLTAEYWTCPYPLEWDPSMLYCDLPSLMNDPGMLAMDLSVLYCDPCMVYCDPTPLRSDPGMLGMDLSVL